MNIDEFLDEVCKYVKYKSVHMEIRSELREHIYENIHEWKMSEEEAVTSMGEPEEIGKAFNKNFHLPFNCRYGLCIWAAMVTVFIYLIYPVFAKLFNNTINTGHNNVVILSAISFIMFINVLFLKRGMLKLSFYDTINVTMGFLLGYVISVIVLMVFSKSGYYLYFSDVKIPIEFPYIPLLPINKIVFGLEFFSWWSCIVIYIISARGKEKTKEKTAEVFYVLVQYNNTGFLPVEKEKK